MKFLDFNKEEQQQILIYYMDYFGAERVKTDKQLQKEIFAREYDSSILQEAKQSGDFEGWNEHIIDNSEIAKGENKTAATLFKEEEKQAILNRIKQYNKTMLKIRLWEKANEQERNFDRRNTAAEQISLAKEAEQEVLFNELQAFLKDKIIMFEGKKIEDCTLKELIFICNMN